MNNPELKSIVAQIKERKFSPVYLLHGEEGFYIDQVEKLLESTVLTEEEKSFNQTIIYGKEFDAGQVKATAREFPMMSEYKVVIVREAQEIRKTDLDKLTDYIDNPNETTILVICYKYGKVDKRSSFYKTIKKSATILESKALYENQVPGWVVQQSKKLGNPASMKAAALLTEFLGRDLSKIHNELKKLSVILETGVEIDTAVIEANIGISKDYNNFELQTALATRDAPKAYAIVKYFAANATKHPPVYTVIVLYQFFEKAMTYHFVKDKSPGNLSKILKVNQYFLKDYEMCARAYSTKKLAKVMTCLKEADLQLKGVGAVEVSKGEILQELIYKILHA